MLQAFVGTCRENVHCDGLCVIALGINVFCSFACGMWARDGRSCTNTDSRVCAIFKFVWLSIFVHVCTCAHKQFLLVCHACMPWSRGIYMYNIILYQILHQSFMLLLNFMYVRIIGFITTMNLSIGIQYI